MKNSMKICLIFFNFIFFISCKSVPVKRELSNLCGLVIDENNNPIKDVVVTVRTAELGKKNAISNASGIFVINDIKLGNLKVECKKEGFSIYEDKNFKFYDRNKILCIKICSADFVLEKVLKNIETDDFENAEKNLKSIFLENSKNIGKVVYEYENFIQKKSQRVGEKIEK